eukprot:CAMPEP_0182544652 /NCGR_PEP_ID=MMETSP1323-20130603/33436_1 /TAXON_ID=236787 /ORGANISM="Florenciella parvula, Strain RCC1693" /LENGTH=153 /DNA_ID=CAMNT_0024755719 /DNA_START=264 /DNA_END=724 /DNA_ORIENTATION=-
MNSGNAARIAKHASRGIYAAPTPGSRARALSEEADAPDAATAWDRRLRAVHHKHRRGRRVVVLRVHDRARRLRWGSGVFGRVAEQPLERQRQRRRLGGARLVFVGLSGYSELVRRHAVLGLSVVKIFNVKLPPPPAPPPLIESILAGNHMPSM